MWGKWAENPGVFAVPRTHNAEVGGSIPPLTTNKIMSEPMGHRMAQGPVW